MRGRLSLLICAGANCVDFCSCPPPDLPNSRSPTRAARLRFDAPQQAGIPPLEVGDCRPRVWALSSLGTH